LFFERADSAFLSSNSADNSAALLTTNLTHFDPKELLTQEFTDSRGFVRTGGAIYGQRPSFPQIKAISTLHASVSPICLPRIMNAEVVLILSLARSVMSLF
jgi:hypothetical protein